MKCNDLRVALANCRGATTMSYDSAVPQDLMSWFLAWR